MSDKFTSAGTILAGSTDVTIYVALRLAADGTGATGLAYDDPPVISYTRTIAARAAITPATQTVTGAHSDGGFVEVDATNCPGLYRLDLPDAAVAAGVDAVVVTVLGASCLEYHAEFALTSVAAGNMTAINGVAAAAARLALSAGQIIPGTVNDANTTPTTTVFAASDITEATADHFNGRLALFTGGALAGQATDINDYALDTGEGKFTVTGLTEAPSDGDTFVVI